MRCSLGAGLTASLVCATVLAAAARQPPQSQTPFETTTTAVVIDVVVRDERGRPVTDLRAADFELYEDGVRQEIGDVTRAGVAREGVDATPAPAPSARAEAPPAHRAQDGTAVRAPTFVALVFDRLTPEARALAYRGALAYLDTSHEHDFAGVFLSDLSLVPIHAYTNDKLKLRAALKDVASRATSVFDRDSMRDPAELVLQSQGDMHPMVPDVASAEFIGRPAELDASARYIQSGPSSPVVGGMGGMAAYRLSLFSFEQLARDQQGYATTNALRAVIEGLSALPGRKTVVFFAEGLSLPDAVMPHFDGVVALANRANVSVYTMDAAGLRVHSKQRETTREVNAISAQSLIVNPDGSTGGSIDAMERLSMVLRTDPRTSLTLLADRTGGFLIENTNDLARGFRAIDADRRFHYLLTYTPKNADFSGEWRRVEVRVPGRKVRVRNRSGYPAVRSLSAIPLLAYEGPALAALERTPPPADLPLRAAALQFPAAGGATRAAILVAAGGQTVTFESTADGFRTDFTLLARVKDARGVVIRKGSRPYRLIGPTGDLPKVRAGDVLFYRQPELPPGRYTVEAVVHDALNGKAGVTRVGLDVPAASALRVSDLVVVERAERLTSDERDSDNPLQVGDRLLYPSLGQPLRRTRTGTVAFYFALAGADASTTARLHVLADGQALADLPVALDAPGADGVIRQVGQIPAGALGTGNVVLRLFVTNGAEDVVREAAARVEITP